MRSGKQYKSELYKIDCLTLKEWNYLQKNYSINPNSSSDIGIKTISSPSHPVFDYYEKACGIF